jgi:EAL domain-containing protein (putative c-di-GMP-specific phosphodiesterase class I)
MQHADAAMYRAKVIRNAYAMYHPSQDGLEPERVSLVSNLRGALDSNQIVVHYQPKVDVDSGRIVGVEALVRWEHPQRGCMLPDEFLEAVESAGLTPILADHVLDRALGQCRTWLDLGMTVPVSVNLSARSLEDAHLHHKVAAALAKWSVPASYLELEFAEATIMPEADRADDTLARLAERGVRIAVDGFAIGYSSLVRLQQLPLTSIKIDRSYLLDVERDTDKQAMVRTVINLAHDLGYAAVAVGVESAEAWHLLRALHCDLAQGFFFSRPQPAPALESLLRQHNPTEMMAVRY